MVRPTKPKEIKPKAEVSSEEGTGKGKADAGAALGGMKLIAVNTVITLIICGLFIAANYFIIQTTIMPSIKQVLSGQGGGEEGSADGSEEGADTAEEHGIILDLGEFILNLSDPKERRYLKVNVALELSKAESDPEMEAAGGGGHGEAADPKKAFEQKMENFTPAIKDSIISTLSSKTAEELSSTTGKELAKQQIKEAVDSVFGGEREVMRVSFGSFIIQ